MMRSRPLACLVLAVLGGCTEQATDPATTQESLASRHRSTSGAVIRTWNEIAIGQQPTNAIRLSRTLAMVHAAMHDAVNGVLPRYEKYASKLCDPDADPEAAAVASAHRVLSNQFPMNQASLDAALASSLDAIEDGPAEDAGVALGAAVGQSIIDFRANDRMDIPDPFTPTPGPGVWEPTPPTFSPVVEPQFHNVTPFAIRARDQFSLSPPPALTSWAYARDFREVFELGRDTSAERTDDQTHSALFWREASPAGWSRIASIVSVDKEYDLHETARLLALVNMVMADGFIAGVHYKRVYALWRPVTAIQRADTDGNPRTTADPTWLPLRATSLVAEYPSTHSVLGAAAADVLRRFTRKNLALCMTSQTAEPAGTTRCWDTFAEASLENADSRVNVGYHFRFSTTAGVQLGKKIGRYGFLHKLRPLRGHHDDGDDADEDDPDEN